MNALISVIVPVYNASKFLEKCICSILTQTYKEIQLILIDNNSTDDSAAIMNKYATDQRVEVYKCIDQGVSFARNIGIEKAKGRYILFVDADDYMEPNMIEYLLKEFSNSNVGMVECGYFCNDKDDVYIDYEKLELEVDFSASKMIGELFIPTVGHYQGYLWNKILLTNIIKENAIQFDTDLKYNEDRLFLCRYLLKLNQDVYIRYIPECKYHYVKHESSAMAHFARLSDRDRISELIAYDRMADLLFAYEEIERFIRRYILAMLWSFLETTEDARVINQARIMLRKTMCVQNNKEKFKSFFLLYDFSLLIYKVHKKCQRKGKKPL